MNCKLISHIALTAIVPTIAMTPISSCNSTKTTIHVDEVTFLQQFSYIENNKQRDFSKEVKILPQNATDKSLTWSLEGLSGNDIATVDQKTGVVTAGSNVGYATLKCVSNDNPKKSSSQTIVTGRYVQLQNIAIEPLNIIYESEPIKPIIHYYPEDATTAKYDYVDIEIQDTTIASYNPDDGKITPLAIGDTTYTVTPYDYDETEKAFVKKIDLAKNTSLSVKYAQAKSITLNPTELTLETGQRRVALQHTVLPEGACQDVTWEIDDTTSETGSTIDATTGDITAGDKGGTAYIKCVSVQNNQVFARAKLNVQEKVIPITKLQITNKIGTIDIGQTWTPNLIVEPSDHTEGYYLTTSDSKIVKCDKDESGQWQVTALKEGCATIYAVSDTKKVKDECKIETKKPIIPVTKITIDPSELTLNVDKISTATLTAKVNEGADDSVDWTSSDTGIITVEPTTKNQCVITAHQTTKEGEPVIITAKSQKYPEVLGTCVVCVKSDYIPVSAVSLNKIEETIKIGDTLDIAATIDPYNATTQQIQWHSSNEGVVEISPSSDTKILSVKGLKTGQTIITATTIDGHKTASCRVAVEYSDVTDIAIVEPSSEPYNMQIGSSHNFIAEVKPKTAIQTVAWKTDDATIASVDSTGKVTALCEGETDITCETEGKDSSGQKLIARRHVKVTKPIIHVESLTLSAKQLNLYLGGPETPVTVTIDPNDAADKSFTVKVDEDMSYPTDAVEWIIRDNKIYINPIKEGYVTLKVISNDNPNIYAVCYIEIFTIHVSSIKIIDPPKIVLFDEPPVKINVELNPEQAYNKKLIWTSSNPDIAYVDPKSQTLVGKNYSNEIVTIKCVSEDNPACEDSFNIKVTGCSFQSDSWENIINVANKGLDELHKRYSLDCERNPQFPGTLIGYTKTIKINGIDHTVRVIDENHDDKANGTGKAALTFELVTLLSDSDGNAMTTMWDVARGCFYYTDSILRKNLTGQGTAQSSFDKTAYDMLPSELRLGIKLVNKQVATTDQYKLANFNDTLFPLTYTEMSQPKTTWTVVEGRPYKYWEHNNNNRARIKRDASGKSINYWLTSPSLKYAINAWSVKTDGCFENYSSDKQHAVSFAFCI